MEGAFVFEPVVFGGRWYLVAMEEEGSQKVGGRVSDRKKITLIVQRPKRLTVCLVQSKELQVPLGWVIIAK